MTRRINRFCPWQVNCGWILLVCLLVSSCSSSSQVAKDILPSISGPSEDEEVRISREFRREARKQLKFVTNPEVERYIDRVGQRILSTMGPQPFDYRFFVIEDSQLNACSAPSCWPVLGPGVRLPGPSGRPSQPLDRSPTAVNWKWKQIP